jgi:signal peptidase I
VTLAEVPVFAGVVVSAGVAILGIWAARRRFVLVSVAGSSMSPTIDDGDRVLVRRACIDDVRVGQVVVVEMPAQGGGWTPDPPPWPGAGRQWLIKRVAALPGDNWPDDAMGRPCPRSGAASPVAVLPPGQFAVLGDNRAASYDSRQMGSVPAARLLGVVIRPTVPPPVTGSATGRTPAGPAPQRRARCWPRSRSPRDD